MLTFLFIVLMFGVFGKLLVFAIKATWGITKIIVNIVFLPLIIIGLFVSGLTYVALVALAVVGIVTLMKNYA